MPRPTPRAAPLPIRLFLIALLAALPPLAVLVLNTEETRSEVMHQASLEAGRAAAAAAAMLQVATTETFLHLRHMARTPEVIQGDKATCEAHLAALRGDGPGWLNLGVADLDGHLFCLAPTYAGTTPNLAQQPSFQRLLRGRHPAVAEIRQSLTTHRPVLTLRQPVFDGTGALVRVANAAIDLGELAQIVLPPLMSAGDLGCLLNTEGEVATGLLAPQEACERLPAAERLALIQAPATEGARVLVAADGAEVLGGVARVEVSGDAPPLFLLLARPSARAFAAVRAGRRVHLLALTAAGLIALFGAGWAARRLVVGPLRETLAAAREIEAGRLDARIRPGRWARELLDLAGSFNRMAEALQRHQQEGDEREGRLRRVTRLYAVLGGINRVIQTAAAAEGPAPALFLAVCEVAAREGELRLAWIGLVDEAAGRVAPVAEAGEGRGYLSRIGVIDLRDPAKAGGPIVRAAKSGEICYALDIPADPGMSPWARAAADEGFRCSAAVPLRQGGRVVGALNLYSRETGFFGAPEEQALLAQIGAALSHALDALADRERRHALHAALGVSEDWFRTIYDNIHDAVAIHDAASGMILDFNRRFTELYGYPHEELHTLEVGILSAEGVEFGQEAALGRIAAAAAGHPQTFEWHARHRDGGLFWVEVSLRQALIGGHKYVIAAVRDIDARKSLEEGRALTLRRMEALRHLADLADTLSEHELLDHALEETVRLTGSAIGYLHFVNEDGTSIDLCTWSAAARADCATVTDHHYPLDQAGVWADCVREGGPVVHNDYAALPDRHDLPKGHIELRRHLSVPVFADGQPRMILGVGNKPAPYDEGDVLQAQIIANEVWGLRVRQRTAERLRLLDRAVTQSPVSVVITDAEGDILYVNPHFAEVTGYTAEEVIGQNPRILQGGETTAEAYRAMWATLTAGGQWCGEFHNRRKDGTLFWEAAVIGPVSHGGRITHYIAVKEEITARKRLEERLRQAQKMEAIGRLAGGVAHDFNNLLMPVLGYGSMLLSDLPEGDPSRERVQQICNAAFRARDLTKRLLTFSRAQALDPRTIDLGVRLQDTGRMLLGALREEVRLRLVLPETPLWVRVDYGQLEQALLNLAINAQDAMPDGGELLIEAHAEAFPTGGEALTRAFAPGDYAVIHVRDQGVGIAPEALPRLFEPFYTTKPAGQGTGFGLPLVYGIVHQHDGYLRVESSPGAGAEFRILLPLQCPPVGVEAAHGPTAPELRRGMGETIVVVEDDDGARALVHRMLTDLGYESIPLASAEECIDLLSDLELHCDLVLTDIIMPGMDGKALCDALQEQRPRQRSCYMSGFSRDLLNGRGLVGAATRILVKPFTTTELGAYVRAALDAPNPGGVNG